MFLVISLALGFYYATNSCAEQSRQRHIDNPPSWVAGGCCVGKPASDTTFKSDWAARKRPLGTIAFLFSKSMAGLQRNRL